MTTLSKAQKIQLASLARQAYAVWPGREAHERASVCATKAFADWRHEQQEKVTGVRSLNHCRAEDFDKLLEHFHRVRMVHLQDSAIEQLTP